MNGKPLRDLIKSHRSIRRFLNKEVPQLIINDLIEHAKWAPSSHNVQSYSIICIRNKHTKEKLAELCGNQVYVKQCPVFFVFIMDFYRHAYLCKKHKFDFEVQETENLLIGAIDTALVAENFLLAARSYGLGGVMIGGIRNEAEEVAKLLKLPKWTLPIVGMCIGYPDQHPRQKPRLVTPAVYHEEYYRLEDLESNLDKYEKITERYYRERTKGKKTDGWGAQMCLYFSNKRREKLTGFIKRQGFDLR
ncbi:oxygen-insensitive NADPH nitroreductase [Virgibacillus necropolis]|uniref:Nitroreductase A n=1 Tax=Virgibacillus necropolis TaxID=163877 RepID=A0A221MF28_9BACI|nr:oxygen-insensitive NADPH nitroreductase [Virgibacillus necropolis]ASN06200.1 nitroreductase A [Virgibacillus necropolis]